MVRNPADIARRYGLSRARVTQVMSLLRIPDEIQEYVMALPPREQRRYSGRRLMSFGEQSGKVSSPNRANRVARYRRGGLRHLAADHLPRGWSSRTQEVVCGHPSANLVRSALRRVSIT